MTRAWPPALLQPDPHTGCLEYSVAYLCRSLGALSATPENAQDYRARTNHSEEFFPKEVCGYEIHRWGEDYDEDTHLERRWWLGPEQRPWVESWFARGYRALWYVHRALHIGHFVVGLEDLGDAGVLIMDPLSGLITESWDWMLGPGANKDWQNTPSHRIEGWYR